MKDNTRIAIGYVCIALVIISYFVMIGWIGSPRDFTFKIEMDNNTKDAFQSINYSEINEIQDHPKNLYEDCEYDGCNYAMINNNSEPEVLNLTYEAIQPNMLILSTNICETNNETTWWLSDEESYCIGQESIITEDCRPAQHSICFSKEFLIAMNDILNDVKKEIKE